jgi:aldose 1-epimerase
MMAPVIICSGDALCELWPDQGGSIGRWTVGGQDMLRRACRDDIRQPLPLGMASFPLVPYSNRIGHAAFTWDGARHQLAANFDPEPHAIHGTGWAAKWDVARVGDDHVTLRNHHEPDAHWPWPFDAEQHISLTADTLSIDLCARNLSDQAVPLSFGHHPYFDRDVAALSFRAARVWHAGADGLPERAETPSGHYDFSHGAPVTGRMLDHGYAGWDGRAEIRWAGRPLKLNITADMAAAVVYIPADGDVFCFEPVPHINNALNLPGHEPQMPVVAPRAEYVAHIRFCARPA